MKVVILAGGLGTRLREETETKPKPMVEIGGRPILWHIMKHYAHYGFRDFVICLGYKGDIIRDYFVNYRLRNSDFTVTLGSREVEVHEAVTEYGWKVTLAESGDKTQTGGRVKRVGKYLDSGTFLVTYGDGVANVDISQLMHCHKLSGRLGTVTAVRPSSRYGELCVENGMVQNFQEKPQVRQSWINGGFFVFDHRVLDLIEGDSESLEIGLLPKLAAAGELAVYQHDGFWQCMDTFREMEILNKMWASGNPPWATYSSDRTVLEMSAAGN
jgi:glucose-1-phosphate cytidylyltransferase